MLGNLIESRRTRKSLGVQGVLSLGLHVGLGIGLLRATTGIAAVHTVPEIIDLPLPPPDAPEPVSHPLPPDPSNPPLAGAPVLVMTPPVDLPIGIPPVDIGPPIDPKRFSGMTGAASACPPACAPPTKGIDSAVYRTEEIDEPARVLSQPTPRFPPVLQAAGLAGRVLLEFVVDTTGHVEPSSVRVLESSHAGFEASASEMALHSLFVPGRVRSRPVRQLMRQAVTYRISVP